ncbi:hypothetical protein WA026_013412 [Henosepilachna vigintioctopunctata]|uniref:Large ribosomal subunit protein mL45 n=1 Tax=Henosepilachna vigintioctopunctata TaxID=420089 RepID=A0AAW1VEX3_9CUCU
MALRLTNSIGLKLLKESCMGFLAPVTSSVNEIVRHHKHWDPKFKWLRRAKVMKLELPKFNEDPDSFSEEEVRSRLKAKGLLPPRPYTEKQFFISNTGGVFEPYVPPEGDGKVSAITAQGAKQKLTFLEKKSKTMMAIRKIKSFEEDFDSPTFLKQAEEIYKKMHECLVHQDKDGIQSYVTERAYPEVLHNVELKTIRWKFLENIELPYIVQARCTDIVTKENIFGQITVRFHTKQMLAIYDRFGRLMHGSEILAKDVLEYVVFEKHLANEYGIWRIHQKIIPDWMPPKEPVQRTYIKEPERIQSVAAKDAPGEKVLIEEPPTKIEGKHEQAVAA